MLVCEWRRGKDKVIGLSGFCSVGLRILQSQRGTLTSKCSTSNRKSFSLIEWFSFFNTLSQRNVWLISHKIIIIRIDMIQNRKSSIYSSSPLMFQWTVTRVSVVYTENKLFNLISTYQLFDLHQHIHFVYNWKVMIYLAWDVSTNTWGLDIGLLYIYIIFVSGK